MKLRLTTAAATVLAAALLSLPLPSATARNLLESLKPDPNKTAEAQNKTFESPQFESGRTYNTKSFAGEKTLKKPTLPKRNFTTGAAATTRKTFPAPDHAAGDKAFNAPQWDGSKTFPTADAPQSEQVSSFQDTIAPQPTRPELGKGFTPPPVLTEEQARKILNDLYTPASRK
jgi:hypothetical protein